MTTKQRIVVGVDGSDTSLLALSWAAAEAELRNATLDVVHAWTETAVGAGTHASAFSVDLDGARAAADAALDDAIDAAALPDGARLVRHAIMGPGAAVLLEIATGADLLVVGTRGRGGVAGLLLGSVSHDCIKAATCPVVVVPAAAG
jgi:nucleotide-binding universal stress UspA family protein